MLRSFTRSIFASSGSLQTPVRTPSSCARCLAPCTSTHLPFLNTCPISISILSAPLHTTSNITPVMLQQGRVIVKLHDRLGIEPESPDSHNISSSYKCTLHSGYFTIIIFTRFKARLITIDPLPMCFRIRSFILGS